MTFRFLMTAVLCLSVTPAFAGGKLVLAFLFRAARQGFTDVMKEYRMVKRLFQEFQRARFERLGTRGYVAVGRNEDDGQAEAVFR